MRIELRSNGEVQVLEVPFRGADHALGTECPTCGDKPLRVAGRNDHIADHDRREADGYCLACRQRVGTIVAIFSTIFGLEEDERMLAGRCRTY